MLELLPLLLACYFLGWLRVYVPPAERFRKAEVVAVARVVPDSVQMYPVVHGVENFSAVLRVSEVLKGEVNGPEVPVVLHHGLTPVVGGYLSAHNIRIDAGHRRAGVIEIWDTGSSATAGTPDVEDAQEHVWVLGRHTDFWAYAHRPVPEYAGQLGVTEPDEILPLRYKDDMVEWLVTFDPQWFTTDVIGLARAIREQQTFDGLPILADALQEAGCDNPIVLNHCRCVGPHVGFCWIVERLLAKS